MQYCANLQGLDPSDTVLSLEWINSLLAAGHLKTEQRHRSLAVVTQGLTLDPSTVPTVISATDISLVVLVGSASPLFMSVPI